MLGIKHLVLDERLHGLQAAPACTRGGAVDIVLSRLVHGDDEVPQQPEPRDGGLEPGAGPEIGRGLAEILGGERESAQRDLPERWPCRGAMEFIRTRAGDASGRIRAA